MKTIVRPTGPKPPTNRKTAAEVPPWIEINLENEDSDAWDYATRSTSMLILQYGVDILTRTAALPKKGQPVIYEMPTRSGHPWNGDRRVLTIPEPLGRAIVRIAQELGVSVNDWAYSAILAETAGSRKTRVTATLAHRPMRAPALRTARTIETELARQSRNTGIPIEELRRMCTNAGLDQLKRGELKVSALQLPGGDA